MRRLFQGLIDIAFPPRCVACGNVMSDETPHPFCRSCFAKIRFLRSPLCSQCGSPFDGAGEDHLCGDCLTDPPFFSVARSVCRYESVLLETIHRFKYGGETRVGEALGRFMTQYPCPGMNIGAYDCLIPVPLHTRRLREREFNQALILAKELARPFNLPVDYLSLKRRLATDPQVSMGKTARRENVQGAFNVARPEHIAGRKILIVDDVYTTGSTVGECARMLMGNEAEDVAVLTLARA